MRKINFEKINKLLKNIPCGENFVPPTRDRQAFAACCTLPQLWRVVREVSRRAGS